MDGNHVDTSPLQRLANYVRKTALAGDYPNLDKPNSGDKARLAKAAGMSPTTLSRLLLGERMPEAKYLTPLARALDTDPLELFVESGLLPAGSGAQSAQEAVASPPITPDDVADAWQVDAFGREMVRAMFERLATPQPAEHNDIGGAEAQ
ncbi:helix-turn-helix domain-containing protein [Kitasatospora sp. NPDC057223]|uniref:helix-turn-helix domain-containing protein n=1 Tax=Kitasatospora sp. NPDC057223 TaxID=3346055 RepID=UPI003626FD37